MNKGYNKEITFRFNAGGQGWRVTDFGKDWIQFEEAKRVQDEWYARGAATLVDGKWIIDKDDREEIDQEVGGVDAIEAYFNEHGLPASNAVEKRGCPSCKELGDRLMEDGKDLVENGKDVMEYGGGMKLEGRARMIAGGAIQDLALYVYMESANTPMTAAIEEMQPYIAKLKEMGIVPEGEDDQA